MGRASLQGTPWHYEYIRSNNGHSSKNCVYNNGHCACKISPNHGHECVGRNDCDEFELSTGSRKPKQKQPSKQRPNSLPKNKTKTGKTVSLGNKIVVESITTKEKIEIPVSDTNNPFYSKPINDIVTVKGIKYKIIMIR